MQELEKILEEIDQEKKNAALSIRHTTGYKAGQIRMAERIEEIIRKHMNDGWIPVNDQLPEEPPEEVDDEDNLEECIVMIEGAEKPTTLRYAGDGTWWENGTYYPVIAWRPLPEPYKPKQPETCKYTGGSCCWPIDQCSDCPNNPERSENDE